VSPDKKGKRNQNRPQNQRAAGLVNANHFYETAEELANRHLEQHQQQQAQQGKGQSSKQKSKSSSPSPETPQQH